MKKGRGLFGLAAVLSGFYVMGFCDIAGFSASYMQEEFSLSETVSGVIPSMVFLWFLLLSMPVAVVMNRIGRKKTVLAGNVVTVVGMLLPAVHFSFPVCLAAFALLGIGNTILQVSLNPLLTNVVSGKALTSSLTAGQVIKALSSLSGPFIASFALSCMGDWKMMFPVFAAITLIPTLLLFLAPIREEKTQAGGVKSIFPALKDRRILALFFGIVAVVGVDVGLNTLAPKLLMERAGESVERAGYASSVYFLCRLIGAFTGTVLLARMADRKYHLIHCLFGTVILLSLMFLREKILILVFLGLAGYAFSSIFSVIYSQALKHRPEYANEISGLMITGVCGGAVVPPLMGISADLTGSQVGSLLILLLFAIYLLICVRAYEKESS